MSKTILLIEDNTDMRENISEILELANYHVITAENGKQGVLKAKSTIPDLIVCDIMMPEMDGYETLYMLGKNDQTKNIPFVFLTAKAEKSDWRKGMNLGADDYLTKPFDDMELLNVVEARIKRSEALKADFQNTKQGIEEFIDTVKSIEELKHLSKENKSKIYKKKEIIFHEGDYAGGVFLIEQGKVKTFKINNDGKEFTTGLYKSGDFIGYKALIENNEQTESAVAIEDTEIYKIHKDDFLSLLYNNREIANAFIKLLSGSLIEKEEELINLAYNSVRKRVADGLIHLADKFKKESREAFSIEIPRDDLASIVGTSTESVIRVLSDFKDEKLIEAKGSNITLVNEDKLRNLKF